MLGIIMTTLEFPSGNKVQEKSGGSKEKEDPFGIIETNSQRTGKP